MCRCLDEYRKLEENMIKGKRTGGRQKEKKRNKRRKFAEGCQRFSLEQGKKLKRKEKLKLIEDENLSQTKVKKMMRIETENN